MKTHIREDQQYLSGGTGDQSYYRQRSRNFGVTMAVMGLSFLLYYLGLFGNVPGPLAPGKIGNTLAGMGVTQVHAMAFFLLLFIIAASWNWVYNFVNLKFGNRMTCKRQIDDDGTLCGALVKRNKTAHSRTGRFMIQYECSHGHKRRDAHFHPIKKGAVSHTLWGISLCFCLMVFYLYGGLP